MTSYDLWPPWKTIGIIYLPRAINIPSLKFQHLSAIEISCLQGFYSLLPLVTSNDLWPPWKTWGITRATDIPCLKFQQLLSSGNFHVLRQCVYKVFRLLPFVTSNDLWPPWKTLRIIYLPRAINIPCLKFQQLLLIEITCLQGFQTFTSGDLKWPLTSMENNRDHLCTKGYQHNKFGTHTHTHTRTHTQAMTIA